MEFTDLEQLKLTDTDKFILNNNLIHRNNELSFFSKNVTFKSLGDYNYYETSEETDIYYLNMFFPLRSLFIDKNKKIIFGSKYYHSSVELKEFLKYINSMLISIKSIDLEENNVFIGTHIISIQKWFVTYGHYVDEAYSICDFHNKLIQTNNRESYKILLEYHTDNEIVKNYPVFNNYKIIDNYLFENNSINAYDYKKQILKMNKLILIKHYVTDKTFHSFPLYPRNLIMSKIQSSNEESNNNVYISRGKAVHIKRNFDNEDEILNYSIANNYKIVNPELLSIDEFINSVKNATNIIMSWGGILTNMIYFKQNTRVIILKSMSYENESINLFKKIIDNYNLEIKIILHKDNKIDVSLLR
jgi:hypothetical protein